MRQIFPPRGGAAADAGDAVLARAYAYPTTGLWVRANMVTSADGAATVQGRTARLSAEPDQRLFALLRCLSDVILVGAQTARTEEYGPVKTRAGWEDLRAGRPPSPPIAVVTRRIDLDLDSPLLRDAPGHARTIVITTQDAPPERLARAQECADVLIAGRELVDLRAAVTALADRGLQRILTEGGPRLLGQMVTAGLLDELCLTVSPVLAGGDAGRIMAYASLASPEDLRLAQVHEAGGSLFCRYLRAA